MRLRELVQICYHYRRGQLKSTERASKLQWKRCQSRKANKAYFDKNRCKRPESHQSEIQLYEYDLPHDTRLDPPHS